MRRDMDLVRELLLKLEAEPLDGNLWRLDLYGDGSGLDLRLDGRPREDVAYHLVQLIDGELLDGQRELSGGFVARKLTWAGHDFLDSVRDPKVWSATKDKLRKVGGFTVDIMVSTAKEIIKHELIRLTGTPAGG